MNPIEITLTKATIIEMVAEAAHVGWMAGKEAQGIESRLSEWGEELMVPYADLSEQAKDLDRSTCKTVVDQLDAFGLLIHEQASLTYEEVKGLRMALRFGVPTPEPPEIASARGKLDAEQARLEGARGA